MRSHRTAFRGTSLSLACPSLALAACASEIGIGARPGSTDAAFKCRILR